MSVRECVVVVVVVCVVVVVVVRVCEREIFFF